MAVHLDGSNSPKSRAHWLADEDLPGYPYLVVVNSYSSHMSVPMATGKPIGMRAHLLTTHFSTTTLADSGHNPGEFHSCFRLHGFSWCPPRDANNCDGHGRHSTSTCIFFHSAHGHQLKGSAVLQRQY